MRAPQADRADVAVADREGEAVRNIVNQAIGAKARFFEPIVVNGRQHFKISGSRQRNAVLGDVGGVFDRVEFNVHENNVPPINSPVND